MHTEALAAWRQLVDVRFKLLAFVPSVSVLALTQLLDFNATLTSGARWARVGLAVVGLVLVAALAVYDLISRVRRAEAELGVHTGIALGRRTSRGLVKHDKAIAVIYGTSLLTWLAAAVALLAHALS